MTKPQIDPKALEAFLAKGKSIKRVDGIRRETVADRKKVAWVVDRMQGKGI